MLLHSTRTEIDIRPANTCAHELEFIARNNRRIKSKMQLESYAAASATADAVENEIAKEAIRRREHLFHVLTENKGPGGFVS
jgi:hypothetical protein